VSASSPRSAPRRRGRAHEGQALVEYLLVISVVAVLCIPAFSFLQAATNRAYGDHEAALNDPPLGSVPASTPTARITYSYPASEEQCKNGGWQTFVTPDGTFKNQGDCQSWVSTNGRNAPSTPAPTATVKAAAPVGSEATAVPTVTAGNGYSYPASEDECKNGGWQTFVTPDGTFKNQGDCQSWVSTNGRNAPSTPAPTATVKAATTPAATATVATPVPTATVTGGTIYTPPTATIAATATAIYRPPTATPAPIQTATPIVYSTPKNRGQCNNGKWQDYYPPTGPFKSEAECLAWVDNN
jgi:Flp pilus assembly pilin Flp